MKSRPYLPIVIGSAVLALALGLAEWRQANPPWAAYQPGGQVRTLIPTISNQPELCLTCHYGIEEISPSHPTDVFGCVACHGGDPLSLEATKAHRGLRGPGGNPADLSVVEQSCGTANCHGGDSVSDRNHILRVQRSLQATYAGAINAVLEANGLAAEPQGLYAVQSADYGRPAEPSWLGTGVPGINGNPGRPSVLTALAAFDPVRLNHPAAAAFANNCLACHLNAQPIAAPYFYRGTGCAACHTPYSTTGLYTGGDPTISHTEPGHPAAHRLTVLMPYIQCAHCHGRGDYSVGTLAFTPRPSSTLTGSRATDYQPHRDPKATKCERELDCIDCHNAGEVMGDGYVYPNLNATPLVACRTCHGTLNAGPPLMTLTDPNNLAFRRDALNANYSLHEGDTVVQAPNGEALGATRWAENRLVLTSRITGQTFRVPLVQGSQCKQNVEQQKAAACRECHATP